MLVQSHDYESSLNMLSYTDGRTVRFLNEVILCLNLLKENSFHFKRRAEKSIKILLLLQLFEFVNGTIRYFNPKGKI